MNTIIGLNATRMPRCESVGSAILTKRFGLPSSESTVTVPDNYKHATLISEYLLMVRSQKKVCHLSLDFTGENFSKTTIVLKAGITYRVALVPVLKTVNGQECLNFMLDNNYLFVGAQGLVLAQEAKDTDFLQKNNWVASFDNEDALYLGSTGHYMVPSSYINCDRGSLNSVINGGLRLNLRPFCGPWKKGDCLLCYSEE